MTEYDAQVLSQPFRERIYRRNFSFFLADNIMYNVAMGIIGATTVIPDFVRHLTASEVLIGLFATLPTIGSSLPQLLVARYIVRHARKKWWYIGPNIPARSMVLIFAMIMLSLGKTRQELVLPAFFICYSVASFGNGLVGVPWAVLAGTSLDNRWRARVLGLTNACTGLLMLGIAPLIGVALGNSDPSFPTNYSVLFGAAGVLFVLGIVPELFFHELPGGKALERLPSLGEFLPDLGRVLRDDMPFRAFIVTRMFTSLFLMAAPFYIGYATVQLGLSSQVAVPVLLAMQTVGSLAGALAYTWLGARSNLLSIRLALSGLVLLPICALLAGMAGPLFLYFGFLMSGLATSIWNSSYLNWIVGYAKSDRRATYVGLSNTLAAVTTLSAPFIGGTIVQTVGYSPLFAVSLVMALSALFVTLRFLRNS
jgi:MFS family permease